MAPNQGMVSAITARRAAQSNCYVASGASLDLSAIAIPYIHNAMMVLRINTAVPPFGLFCKMNSPER